MPFACNKTTPFSESCRHVDVQQASNMQTCAETVFANVCSRVSVGLQVDLLMLRRKRLLCPQQWMAKSSSHQLVQSQSHQKAASSLRPGPQGSLERIYTFRRSTDPIPKQPWSLYQGSLGSLDTVAPSIGTFDVSLNICPCVRCFFTSRWYSLQALVLFVLTTLLVCFILSCSFMQIYDKFNKACETLQWHHTKAVNVG